MRTKKLNTVKRTWLYKPIYLIFMLLFLLLPIRAYAADGTNTGDPDFHYKVCEVCGYLEGAEPHVWKYSNVTATTHDKECTVCGYKVTGEAHNFVNNKCECGRYNTVTVHFDLNLPTPENGRDLKVGPVPEGVNDITYNYNDPYYGDKYGIVTPTLQDYIFKGWYTQPECGTLVSSTMNVTNSDAHTLYAQWEALPVKITSLTGKDIEVIENNGQAEADYKKNHEPEAGLKYKYSDNSEEITAKADASADITKYFYEWEQQGSSGNWKSLNSPYIEANGLTIKVKNAKRDLDGTKVRLKVYNNAGKFITSNEIIINVYWLPTIGTTNNIVDDSLAETTTATFDNEKLKLKIQLKRSSLTSFVRANEAPAADVMVANNLVSTSDSEAPIYAWANSDETTISWYSEAKKPMLEADFPGMFYNCTKLTDISGLSSWNTTNATNMSYMFQGCSKLTNITPLSSWNTANVTDMNSMFIYCRSLADLSALSSWDTGKVTNMEQMFYKCTGLTDISGLSSWNTRNVTDLSFMFRECSKLTDISGLSSWDTRNVTNMEQMFYKCTGLTDLLALSSWDTGKVTNMNFMFSGCTGLTDISALSSWNTGNVEKMMQMFATCNKLTNASGINDWDISKVTNFFWMFYRCPSHPNFTKHAGTWDSEGTFTPTQPQDPELTIDRNTVVNMMPGETIDIAGDIHYSGDGILTYESSKPSVATVSDDGNTIKAISPGTTTITISASKTANYNAASIQVQVNVQRQPSSGTGSTQH